MGLPLSRLLALALPRGSSADAMPHCRSGIVRHLLANRIPPRSKTADRRHRRGKKAENHCGITEAAAGRRRKEETEWALSFPSYSSRGGGGGGRGRATFCCGGLP